MLPEASLFSCSQAAVTMLTKCLAVELGCHGIRANSVRPVHLPAGIEDCSNSIHPEDVQRLERYLRQLEKRTVIEKELNYSHVVKAILFLSGPNSASITGTAITVDAGITNY